MKIKLKHLKGIIKEVLSGAHEGIKQGDFFLVKNHDQATSADIPMSVSVIRIESIDSNSNEAVVSWPVGTSKLNPETKHHDYGHEWAPSHYSTKIDLSVLEDNESFKKVSMSDPDVKNNLQKLANEKRKADNWMSKKGQEDPDFTRGT